jgi:hypothetical protein
MRVLGLFLGITCAALGGAFGCQSLADIEERSLASDATGGGSSGPPPSDECVEYCDTVMTNCSGDFVVYKSRDVCLDVCAALDPGDPLEPAGNTVACRMFEAKEAAREADAHCASAGPGGGDTCGSDCEAWCGLLEQACPTDYAVLDDCEALCAGLPDNDTFDANTYYEADTIECRLIHVGAALRDPTHCSHAAFNPTARCLPGEDEEPTCANLCQLVQTTCTGDNAVYESEEQCLAVCEVFEPGTGTDNGPNTVGCRNYHAGSAATAPGTHCKHAGPSGDGHCGAYMEAENRSGNCESYCLLLETACGEEADYPFASQEDCESTCQEDFAETGAADDSGYSVDTAAEDPSSLQCRTLHAARALTDDSACAAALGGAPCSD